MRSIERLGPAIGTRQARPTEHSVVSRGGIHGPNNIPQRFLRRIERVYALSGQERAALLAAVATPIMVVPQADLIVEGEKLSRGYLLEEGWGCRYRLLNDGRRQILNFVLPGDCVGSSGSLIDTADHSVCTLTPCRLYPFSASALGDAGQRFPGLHEVFGWSGRRDLAMLLERIVDLGRRTARERVAHLILELLYRLRFVGLSDGHGFDLPLTQEMLADALGLSNVHVNRTLRRLNKERLIQYQPGRIEVIDSAALTEIAEFDEDYLHHSGLRPRGRARLREIGSPV